MFDLPPQRVWACLGHVGDENSPCHSETRLQAENSATIMCQKHNRDFLKNPKSPGNVRDPRKSLDAVGQAANSIRHARRSLRWHATINIASPFLIPLGEAPEKGTAELWFVRCVQGELNLALRSIYHV